MRYLLLIMATFFVIGCSNVKNDNHDAQKEIKQPIVPQTKNKTLKPPSIPTL